MPPPTPSLPPPTSLLLPPMPLMPSTMQADEPWIEVRSRNNRFEEPQTIQAFLDDLALPHLAANFEDSELSLRDLASRAASSRLDILRHLKEVCKVVKLQERQRLATSLARLSKRLRVLESAGEAASSIAASGAAPLLVRATFGMANQLRVLLSYREIAKRQGRGLVLIWNVHADCPGSFRDLFEPIGDVVVVDSIRELQSLRPEWARHACLPDDAIGTIGFTHPQVEGDESIEAAMYAPLRPSESVASEVAERLIALGAGPFIACLVRRSDHFISAEHNKVRTTDFDFFDFIDRQPAEWPIFLATDNRQTQLRFLERYASRVKGLKPIVVQAARTRHEGEGTPLARLARADAAFCCDEDVEQKRHTPLCDAVVELFTCVQAASFKGSYYSSFSDAIMRLRRLRGSASDADEHDCRLPSWHCVPRHDASIALDDPLLLAAVEARSTGRAPHEDLEAFAALAARVRVPWDLLAQPTTKESAS